jgi:uncharacterized protein (DUF305 family)
VNTRTRLTVITAALAAAVAAGGAAWAATAQSSTESADSTPRVGGHNQSMMDADMPMMGGPSGQAMGGEFSADEPFDLQFIDQMTMHHQGALMSTAAMIADSDRPELRQLAAAIEVSQTAQIDQMQTWRTEWYGDAAATAGGMDIARTEQMMAGEAMSGMEDMMGGRGEDMYLQMMIVHHQLGVDMAEEAITRSERPQIRELAQEIADEQSAQIALMRGYLSEG